MGKNDLVGIDCGGFKEEGRVRKGGTKGPRRERREDVEKNELVRVESV